MACLASMYLNASAQPAGAPTSAEQSAAWNDIVAASASPAEVRITLNTLLLQHPADARLWVRLGLLEGQLHQFAAAERDLRHALTLEPGSAQAHYLLGLALVSDPKSKLDWPGAIQEFRTTLRLRPRDADAAMYVGVGLAATDHAKEAVLTLKHAVELDPRSPSAWFNLALAEEATGVDQEADAAYLHAIALRPGFATANAALGKLLLRRGDQTGAAAALRRALAADPDLQDAHYALGQALRAQHLTAQAGAEFAIAQTLNAREPNGIASAQKSNAAMAQAARGDLPGAEAMLRQAITLRPDYGVPHYNLGLILADRREWDTAISQLAQAASLMPGEAPAWFDLGRVLRAERRASEALLCLRWAMALSPSARTAEELRSAAEDLGQPPPAHANQPPFGVKSQTPEAFTVFAEELSARDDAQGAVGMLLRALSLGPAAVAPRLKLAAAYLSLNNTEQSRQELQKVLNVDPASSEARNGLQLAVMP